MEAALQKALQEQALLTRALRESDTALQTERAERAKVGGLVAARASASSTIVPTSTMAAQREQAAAARLSAGAGGATAERDADAHGATRARAGVEADLQGGGAAEADESTRLSENVPTP
jgi:hypothetical protein